MTDQRKKYRPNGTPLTEHERELLILLMEECAEVTQAASKLVRFGKENRPDNGVSNVETLSAEIGDLRCVMDMVSEAGLSRADLEKEFQGYKRERLKFFMQTAEGERQ